jgi:hypothetical protein
MGNAPIERADWKPIAKAVEDRLYGREALLERTLSEAQTHWVDRIVRQVGNEGRWQPLATAPANEDILDGVRADAVSHTDTAELGPVLLGWEIWKRLSMPEVLETLGFNRSQSQAAAISVINRLADPSSEHSLMELVLAHRIAGSDGQSVAWGGRRSVLPGQRPSVVAARGD